MFAKYVANMRAMLFCYFVLWLHVGYLAAKERACMTDIDQETFLGAFIILSFEIFQLHISTSLLNSLFFAINYPYLWDKNQEWNSEIVEFFFCCHWKIHAEPWSDEFQKIRIQSPKITFRQRGRRVCVFSCIQFEKMGLASIFWRLGIQQSWRSEGRELVAKPADVCLCYNLVHLLTRLGFKSCEMLMDVEFSPSAT